MQENRQFTEWRYELSVVYAIGEVEWRPFLTSTTMCCELHPFFVIYTRTFTLFGPHQKHGGNLIT